MRAIAGLPFGQKMALRVYNRLLMHLRPIHRTTTVFGAKMDCDVRDMIQATITHLGAWEPRATKAFGRIITPGDTVIDVGANIGYYSLLFSKLVGDQGRVIAIDALESLAGVIRHHAELNGRNNIEVVTAAVTDFDGSIDMYQAPQTNIGMSTTRKIDGYAYAGPVHCAPLANLVDADAKEHTTVIKIDVEGAEIPILKTLVNGIRDWPRLHSVAVELSSLDEDADELFKQFVDLGFRAFDLHNEYGWLSLAHSPEIKPSEINAAPSSQTDVLFTRLPNFN